LPRDLQSGEQQKGARSIDDHIKMLAEKEAERPILVSFRPCFPSIKKNGFAVGHFSQSSIVFFVGNKF